MYKNFVDEHFSQDVYQIVKNNDYNTLKNILEKDPTLVHRYIKRRDYKTKENEYEYLDSEYYKSLYIKEVNDYFKTRLQTRRQGIEPFDKNFVDEAIEIYREPLLIHTACEYGSVDCIKLLIKYKTNVDVIIQHWGNKIDAEIYVRPLSLAVMTQKIEAVKLLLEANALSFDLIINETGPLWLAVHFCKNNDGLEIVKLLLKYNFCIHSKLNIPDDGDGYDSDNDEYKKNTTPLIHAIELFLKCNNDTVKNNLKECMNILISYSSGYDDKVKNNFDDLLEDLDLINEDYDLYQFLRNKIKLLQMPPNILRIVTVTIGPYNFLLIGEQHLDQSETNNNRLIQFFEKIFNLGVKRQVFLDFFIEDDLYNVDELKHDRFKDISIKEIRQSLSSLSGGDGLSMRKVRNFLKNKRLQQQQQQQPYRIHLFDTRVQVFTNDDADNKMVQMHPVLARNTWNTPAYYWDKIDIYDKLKQYKWFKSQHVPVYRYINQRAKKKYQKEFIKVMLPSSIKHQILPHKISGFAESDITDIYLFYRLLMTYTNISDNSPKYNQFNVIYAGDLHILNILKKLQILSKAMHQIKNPVFKMKNWFISYNYNARKRFNYFRLKKYAYYNKNNVPFYLKQGRHNEKELNKIFQIKAPGKLPDFLKELESQYYFIKNIPILYNIHEDSVVADIFDTFNNKNSYNSVFRKYVNPKTRQKTKSNSLVTNIFKRSKK